MWHHACVIASIERSGYLVGKAGAVVKRITETRFESGNAVSATTAEGGGNVTGIQEAICSCVNGGDRYHRGSMFAKCSITGFLSVMTRAIKGSAGWWRVRWVREG